MIFIHFPTHLWNAVISVVPQNCHNENLQFFPFDDYLAASFLDFSCFPSYYVTIYTFLLKFLFKCWHYSLFAISVVLLLLYKIWNTQNLNSNILAQITLCNPDLCIQTFIWYLLFARLRAIQLKCIWGGIVDISLPVNQVLFSFSFFFSLNCQ